MPAATQLHGAITGRAIPTVAVPTTDGGSFSLGELRGRRQAALLLAHGAGCLRCLGYARQLSRQREALDAAGATIVVVVEGPAESAAEWAEALEPGSVLVGDPDGAWKAAVARHLDVSAGDTTLVLLDRYLAPRVVTHARDAGGLTDPSEATDWLRFIELECPECSGEIEWPEADLSAT
jgi:peroxiredoxin